LPLKYHHKKYCVNTEKILSSILISMSNLAFYATPIDFNKNDKLEQKVNEMKKNKLNSNMLKKLSVPSKHDIDDIHSNMKEENENTLADYYSNEMAQDLKQKIKESESKQDLYQNENINTDYLISNNMNLNQFSHNNQSHYQNKDELLNKLNYIIDMFEEQKDHKTNQKNEEVVLYCFLGIFIIYVLDSFVYIGKYKR
jgi:hypothetical protein